MEGWSENRSLVLSGAVNFLICRLGLVVNMVDAFTVSCHSKMMSMLKLMMKESVKVVGVNSDSQPVIKGLGLYITPPILPPPPTHHRQRYLLASSPP